MRPLTTIVGTLGLVALAVALGAMAGSVNRSAVRTRAPKRVEWPAEIVGGIALRLMVETIDLPGGVALLVASYGLLIAACLKNLSWTGTGVVAFGLLLMVLPTVLNGGMPVDADALASVGGTTTSAALAGERHLSQPGDVADVLSDIVPVPFMGRVVSFGELIALVGLADVVSNVVARRYRRVGMPVEVMLPRQPVVNLRDGYLDDDTAAAALGRADADDDDTDLGVDVGVRVPR